VVVEQSQSQSFLNRTLDERSTSVGRRIAGFAGELHAVGGRLREYGVPDVAARYADRAADLVSGIGNYLQHADGDRLIGDLETFTARQPWIAAGGALVAGFAASRFLKASRSGHGFLTPSSPRRSRKP
jgi:hypothetical protein